MKEEYAIDGWRTGFMFIVWAFHMVVGGAVTITFAKYLVSIEEPLKLIGYCFLIWFVLGYIQFVDMPRLYYKIDRRRA